MDTVKAIEKITSLSVGKDDWHMYIDENVYWDSARHAMRFVEMIADIDSDPFICPTEGGGIQLEWQGKREFEIEFFGDDVSFLVVDENWKMHEESFSFLELEDKIEEIINTIKWTGE